MNENSYSVKTHVFEGPLDTLLSLIEKRKLFISDISLAQVADDFIEHVKNFENFPIAESAQFILIASTLVLIKSKSLLPGLMLTEEEQSNIEDLEDRLKQYQKYKDLSLHLRERFGKHVMFAKLPTRNDMVVFTPDKNTSVARIFETIKAVLSSIPKKEFVPKALVQKVISLEETIENLTHRITASLKMSFRDFATRGKRSGEPFGKEEKVTIIVSFLAMLELVKQGIIHVKQEADFQDIEMETSSVGVPRY